MKIKKPNKKQYRNCKCLLITKIKIHFVLYDIGSLTRHTFDATTVCQFLKA